MTCDSRSVNNTVVYKFPSLLYLTPRAIASREAPRRRLAAASHHWLLIVCFRLVFYCRSGALDRACSFGGTTRHTRARADGERPHEQQLREYRLTTAEIIYRLPDHPDLLQSFIWQKLDLAPDFPELRRFLEFWSRNIEGKLHSVKVGQARSSRPAAVPPRQRIHCTLH